MSEALRLSSSAADFAERFDAFMLRPRAPADDVAGVVKEIIDAVRARGDNALIEYSKKFDSQDLTPQSFRISDDEIAAAADKLDSKTGAALELAAGRITEFAKRQLPQDINYTDEAGVQLGARWTPIDAAGLYVPGGAALYPSSVLMNAIPARVAGVERLVMCVPLATKTLAPPLAAAARLGGVSEVYRIGGAQAVAAMAYGTSSIAAVDFISGPGNAYVAEAKRQVFGQVGIDSIAGPSEILVVADASANVQWTARDLLSQAEHDAVAQSILICDDEDFADGVSAEIDKVLATLPRTKIARASWEDNGAIFIVGDLLKDAPPLINKLAPEHLMLAVAEPQDLLAEVRHAGAIFLGHHTPEAIGDYLAGPNHILPTARAARYASGLAVTDFMKRSSIISCDAEALAALGGAAATLAEAEGLDAHAASINIRLNKK